MRIKVYGYQAMSIKLGNLELELGYFSSDNPVALDIFILGLSGIEFYFFDITVWKFSISLSLDL